MTPDEFESLLYEDEGTALDFKRDQYPFDRASKLEKGELLKDVLAFANSWRRATAYILVGVKEVKGGRSEVVGVDEHLDDANLQQFVNSKTNRPVNFAYREFSVGDASVGIISIPSQHRPSYLSRAYGGLKENVVYVRRGSSTVEASPEEIARMGAAAVVTEAPTVHLHWANIRRREQLGASVEISSTLLEPKLPPNTFAQRSHSGMIGLPRNPDFSSDLIQFTADRALLTGLGLHLENTSEAVARRVRFVGKVTKAPGLQLRDWSGEPICPEPVYSAQPMRSLDSTLGNNPDPQVQSIGDSWEVSVDFGDVRPHDEVWTTDVLYVGSAEPCDVRLVGELRGDNLRRPVPVELEVRVTTEARAMMVDDVREAQSE